MIVTAGPIANEPNGDHGKRGGRPHHSATSAKPRNAGGYCQKANDQHVERLLEEGATRASLQSSSLKVCPQCPHDGGAELDREHLAERHADGGESETTSFWRERHQRAGGGAST